MASRRAPASTAFSTSSLTTEAGRSTTSPAAICFARSGGRRLILPPLNPAAIPNRRKHADNHLEADRREPPELRIVAAGKVLQMDVHAVDAGEERRRHENR